jgi:hypothetical protein
MPISLKNIYIYIIESKYDTARRGRGKVTREGGGV